MSKKKTKWVSNTPTDYETGFLTEDVLNALIDQEYGLKSKPNPANVGGNLPQGIRDIIKDTAREAYTSTGSTTNESGGSFEGVVREMYGKKGIEIPTSPAPDMSPVNTPVSQPNSTHTDETANPVNDDVIGETGLITIETRDVSIIEVGNGKSKDIHITDGCGNSISVPIAKESDPDYSITNLIKNIAAMNNVEESQVSEDVIQSSLYDLATTMAQVQVLWGKPTFVADVSDLDDDLYDNHVHSYDGTKLVVLYPTEDSVGGGGPVYGYSFADMNYLIDKWYQIIKTYFDMHDNEKVDCILITLQLAYQMMIDRRYIGYNQLGEYITDYLNTNDDTMNRDYSTYFANIVLGENAEVDDVFVIKWKNSINEVITQSVEDILFGSSYEALQMYFDHSDALNGHDDDYDDEDESGDDVTEMPERQPVVADPIAMAESYANEFIAKHQDSFPNIKPTGNGVGYVRNPESAGAPVGEEDFRDVSNRERVNTEEAHDDYRDASEGINQNGESGSDNSESNPQDVNENGNGGEATHRSWDPSVSHYEKQKEAPQEEKEEGNRHGDSNGIKNLQEAPEEVKSDGDDDLIINVTKG